MSDLDAPYSGLPCRQAGCNGVLRVETTEVIGEFRRRYLKCNKCGRAPENNKYVLPLRNAPRQASRRKKNLS